MTAHVRPWYAKVLVVLGCVLATIGALAVIAAAFALSFDAIEAVGVASGINSRIAWMLPVSIDGAMLVATITAILLRYLRRPAWYPWFVVVAGVAISVACNAAHAGLAGGLPRLELAQARAVSAIPAVTLFLSVHLLITLALAVLREPAKGAAPAAEVTQPAEVTTDLAMARPDEPEAIEAAPVEPPALPPADAAPAETPAGQAARQDDRTKQDVEQVVRALREANPTMSQRKIAAAALTSPATVRRILAADTDAPISSPPDVRAASETGSPELVAVGAGVGRTEKE